MEELLIDGREPTPPRGIERRRSIRFQLNCLARLFWTDELGNSRRTDAHGIDISEHGLGLLIGQPVPLQSPVYLELSQSRAGASGRVRSCRRFKGQWRLGLELNTPLS